MSQIISFGSGGGGGGGILTITGNSGGAVGPNGGGNVNVVGSGSITVTGNPGIDTLTISSSAGSVLVVTNVNHAASPYTVLSTDQFISVDSSGGVVTILLPNAPATGTVFYVKDSTGSASSFNITVTTVGGAVTIDGSTTFVMNTAYESINIIFNGSNYLIF